MITQNKCYRQQLQCLEGHPFFLFFLLAWFIIKFVPETYYSGDHFGVMVMYTWE